MRNVLLIYFFWPLIIVKIIFHEVGLCQHFSLLCRLARYPGPTRLVEMWKRFYASALFTLHKGTGDCYLANVSRWPVGGVALIFTVFGRTRVEGSCLARPQFLTLPLEFVKSPLTLSNMLFISHQNKAVEYFEAEGLQCWNGKRVSDVVLSTCIKNVVLPALFWGCTEVKGGIFAKPKSQVKRPTKCPVIVLI